MFARLLISLWLCLGAAVCGVAADPRPMVGPGASKDDVIDAYGWPSGQSQTGTKEMLSYPQGVVLLEKGRVEKVDFAMNVAWAPPRPRPGPSPAVPTKIANEQIDFWLTNFDAAAREAARRNARILALFTGSDWSAACRQFNEDVAFHPEFVNAFTGDFVFLQVDFPKRPGQPAELREHNAKLRERYAVTTYPTLLVISADGAVLATVDLEKKQPGNSYRERILAAVRETRDAISGRPSAAEVKVAAAPAPASAATTLPPGTQGVQFAAAARSVRSMVAYSVLIGLAIAGGLIWLVWRKRPAVPGRALPERETNSTTTNGLPTRTQIAAWTNQKVRAVTAALAESEGYVVAEDPHGAGKDLVLKQPGETQPRVVVCCAAGMAGPVAAKRVREFLGTLLAEGVPTGWFVAAGGFAAEARVFAEEHGLVLIDGEQLLAQLRDLPPMVLPKVLARAA